MKKWEYKLFTSPEVEGDREEPIEKFLDELGSDGWEVVTFSERRNESGSKTRLSCKGLAKRERRSS